MTEGGTKEILLLLLGFVLEGMKVGGGALLEEGGGNATGIRKGKRGEETQTSVNYRPEKRAETTAEPGLYVKCQTGAINPGGGKRR